MPSAALDPAPLPFAAFVVGEAADALARRVADLLDIGDPFVARGGVARAVRDLRTMPTPGLLLIDLSGSREPLDDLARLAESCDEGTQVVALGDVNDVELYRSLIRAGVQEYFTMPASAENVAQAMQRPPRLPPTDAPAVKVGRLIGIVGARGGVGATSIAVNVASTLAARQKQKVALVDLDLFFGTCGLALDLDLGRGFREALENPGRIDALFIERALSRKSEHLCVLSAEEPLENVVKIDPAALDLLFDHLRRDFPFVVIDLPRFAARTQGPVFTTPATAVVVSDASLAGMRDTMRLLKLLEKTAPKAERCVVVNRVGAMRPGELAIPEFEKGIEAKVDVVIPWDVKAFAVTAATGKPLSQAAPGCKAALAVEALSRRAATVRSKPAAAPLWKRVLKRGR